MRSTPKRLLREESGSILVEVAVYMSLFVLILVGIVDYCFLIEARMQVQEAAAAGAQYGTIPGKYNDFTGMEAAATASVTTKIAPYMSQPVAVNIYACSPGGSAVSRTATCSDGGTPLMFVQVTTSITQTPVMRYTGISSSYTMTGFASYEVPWI
jgi:Flp pilus assembly protein TadG